MTGVWDCAVQDMTGVGLDSVVVSVIVVVVVVDGGGVLYLYDDRALECLVPWNSTVGRWAWGEGRGSWLPWYLACSIVL